MNTTNNSSGRRVRPGIWMGLALAVLVVSGAAISLRWTASPTPQALLPEVERSQLVSKRNRLELEGRVFTGWMLEHYPDGALKSRSSISNGVLNGLSEGWFTGGTLQVSEHFRDGVSHGERRRWDEQGRPVSVAQIDSGRLVGRFQRWHENGVLAEEMTMKAGAADGPARTWFPSGFLKSEVIMLEGKIQSQKTYADGEHRDLAREVATAANP